MITTVKVIEIIPTVWAAAACLPGGGRIHTTVIAENQENAVGDIMTRLHSQRYMTCKKGEARWRPHKDKFKVEVIGEDVPERSATKASPSTEPAIWELITEKGVDGGMVFKAKKHAQPLLTETELKLKMFELTVNA